MHMRIQDSDVGFGGAIFVFEPTERDQKRAQENHRQTLERLNERRGVSWCEMAAILLDRPWHKMDEMEAMRDCILECERRNAPREAAEIAAARAKTLDEIEKWKASQSPATTPHEGKT